MVRYYKAKSNRKLWNDGQLYAALQNVQSGKSIKSTALEFGIPRSTLQKKLKENNNAASNKTQNRSPAGFNFTFNHEQEEALLRVIKDMETRLIGLNGSDVRKLAYQFAEKIKVPHHFNHEKGIAGQDWLRSFMKRHDLSFRKAEHTSSARAHGFNKEAVDAFFKLLEDIYSKHDLTPERIYNVDETGLSVVPKSSPKVIAQKGRRQVGGLVAAERGELVTAEICMSAAGKYMPPMLIFPRVKENLDLLQGAPTDAWAEFHKSGYMQTDIFTRWFLKFIEFSKATPDNPVLLFLDGHVTHVKNLEVIDLANKHGVIILCFPPHCTHKMQPLDVSFNGPLNICFGKEVADFQRKGHKPTLKNLFALFGKAYEVAKKEETAINAFKKCGIWPFNPNVFSKEDFLASEGTSANQHNANNPESEENIQRFEEVMREIINSQDEAHPENHHDEPTATNTLERPSNPQTTPPSRCLPNQVQSNQEVSIPIAFILQAKNLINHLSSSLKAYTERVEVSSEDNGNSSHNTVSSNELLNETPSPNDPSESKNPNEIVVKKKSRKGTAAVITSEAYKNNLLAEKVMTKEKKKITSQKQGKISAETIMAKKKEKIENQKTEKENCTRKRKQASASIDSKKKKVQKPLEVSNEDDLYLEHGYELVTNHSPLSQSPFNENLVPILHENCLSIPSSAVMNTENAIINGEQVEVCYVNEDLMRALNL